MRYNRKILVPYLRSVAEAEMIRECLKSRKSQLEKQINNCQWQINYFQNMNKPYCRAESIVPYIFKIIAYIICSIIGMSILFEIAYSMAGSDMSLFRDLGGIAVTLVWIIFVLDVGIGIGYSIYNIREYIDYNDMYIRQYQNEMNAWNTAKTNCENSQRNISIYRNQLSQCNEEIKVANKECSNVYSSNIIADQFRDVYSATYIYRYFSTSMEDDLDKIIQTLLLDRIQNTLMQIKDELNNIFSSLNSMNCYLNGITSEVRNISSTTEATQRTIAKMEMNDELKMNYLNMIRCNTGLTAYVSTATYLKSFR